MPEALEDLVLSVRREQRFRARPAALGGAQGLARGLRARVWSYIIECFRSA
ncbi:hypothetical protein [Streptomyces sp. NBC_00019]|uniref:hypothetical protein n=1 Tax=Streptomyces sp. NBC_00019 TaxID=2975623 RepID=UPI00324CE265